MPGTSEITEPNPSSNDKDISNNKEIRKSVNENSISDILEQLNTLPLEKDQPYLFIKKNKPGLYVIKNLARLRYGKGEYDIDVIIIPRSKLEELVCKALSSESGEAKLEVVAEHYIRRENSSSNSCLNNPYLIKNKQGQGIELSSICFNGETVFLRNAFESKNHVKVEVYLKLGYDRKTPCEFRLDYSVNDEIKKDKNP